MSPVERTRYLLDRFEVERELDPAAGPGIAGALVVREPTLGEQPLLFRTLPPEFEPAGLFEELLGARGVVHPHLATIHEAGRLEDGRLYFVQDLVEGEQLFAWGVGRDPLELVRAGAQLLRLLSRWGQEGLVPGGRRPLQALVRPDLQDGLGRRPRPECPGTRGGACGPGGQVCVLDPGGLAMIGARGEAGAAWAGVAPERRAGCRVDLRTGLWELGLVLYELLAGASGVTPGPGGELPSLGEVAPELPPALVGEVMRLLRPRPEERPAGPKAALTAWEAACGLSLGAAELPPDPLPHPSLLQPAQLEELLQRARALRGTEPGAATLVLVRGPDRSGKRRLLDEAAVRLQAEGVRVLRAGAERGQGALGPAGPLLRQLLAVDPTLLEGAPPSARWALEELLPHALALPSAGRPEPLEDADGERVRVQDSLSGPFLLAAQRAPLAILAHDLEATHGAARDLLRHLALRGAVGRAWAVDPTTGASEPSPQLLIVATAGPVEAEQEAELEALGTERFAALLRVEGTEPTSPPARAPELDPDDRRVLSALAVLGAPVELSLLAEVCELPRAALRAALGRLRAGGRVEARAGLRVTLPPMVARRVCAQLEAQERAHLARRAVEQLTRAAPFLSPRTRKPEDALWAIELAATPGPAGPAHPALLRELGPAVAGHLEALGAWEPQAELHAVLALADPEQTWQWRRAQAEALHRADAEERAVEVLSHLLLEVGEGDPLLRADLQRRLGLCLRARGEEAGARRALTRARELLGQAEGPRAHLEQARLAALLAEAHIATGEHEDATRACEQGLAHLKEEGVPGAEATRARGQLLGLLGHLAFLRDDPREAEHLLQAGLAVAERQGLVREGARTLQRLGNVALSRGEAHKAETHWKQSLQRWERLGERRGQAHVRSSLAMAAARRGALGEARELLQAALRARQELDDHLGEAASLHNLGFVWTCAGALEEAAAAYRRCLDLRLELGDRWYAAGAASNLGQVLLDLGQAEEAGRHLEQALEWRVELGDRRGEAATLAVLSELDLRRGDFARALVRAVRAQRLRGETGDVEDEVDMLRRVARLQLGLGDLRGAQRAAERAFELGLGQGLQLHEGPGRLLLGEVLARRGARDRARQELERARRAADAIGDRFTSRAAQIELSALQLAAGNAGHARALLDSRPVPRPGRMQPVPQGAAAPDRQGVLRVRERLLRARIELAREGGSVHVAARCAEEALESARLGALRDLEWRATYALAATFELREAHEEALALTVETQEVVEELCQAVPPEHREGWLQADPVRAAALRGDSPLKALGVSPTARVPGRERETELVAMLELKSPPAQPDRAAEPPRVEGPRIQMPPALAQARRGSGSGEGAPLPTISPGAGVAREDFAVLIRLNRKLVDEVDVRRVFEALVGEAVRLCEAERGFLGVFGPGPDELRLLAQEQLEEATRPRERFARRCAWKAADTGQLVISADVKVDPAVRARAQVLGLGLRTVLAVPVRVPDGQRGALYLDCTFQPDRFGPREVELAEVLADQCALALGRAALETALRERRGGSGEGLVGADGLPGSAAPDGGAAGGAGAAGGSTPRPPRARPRPVVRVGEAAAGFVLAGRSPAMQAARAALEEFAQGRSTLVLEGPPGVGKGTLARAAHAAAASGGAAGPLIVVDLRELDPEAAERELFGHEAHAVSGGEEARPGLFRQAQGGTLLLERLDEAAPAVQALLVQALEAQAVRPVGAEAQVPLQARVIATCTDLEEAERRGALRPDLLALISQLRVRLPALGERPEDVGPLVEAILAGWEGGAAPEVPAHVRVKLEERHYPGNLRELVAVLRAAAARAQGRPLQPSDLPAARRAPTWELAPALRELERRYLQGALRAHGGDQVAAARALGITRRALQTKLEQLEQD